jgi:hypothetical protein
MNNLFPYIKYNFLALFLAFLLGLFASLFATIIWQNYIDYRLTCNPIRVFPNKLELIGQGCKTSTAFTVYNASSFTCFQVGLKLSAKDENYDIHSLNLRCPKTWLSMDFYNNENANNHNYIVRLEVLNPHETAIFNVNETHNNSAPKGTDIFIETLGYSTEPPLGLDNSSDKENPDEGNPEESPNNPVTPTNVPYNKENTNIQD